MSLQIWLVAGLLLGFVSLNAYSDTYQASRQYRVQIGTYVPPAIYPSFAAAAQAAWDAYQVPSFWPNTTKVDWFTNRTYPPCQTKEEPGFVSQGDYVEVDTTIMGANGAIGCTSTFNYAVIYMICPYGGSLAVDKCYNAPPCPVPQKRDVNTGKCGMQESYKLSLTPEQATIEPGQSTTFTATVTTQDGNAPSQPVPVTVKVEVDATSGGHDHGEAYAERPKGTVSPTSGINSLNIAFNSTEVSGTHKITATCDMCANSPQTATVDVKVANLEPIPASFIYDFIGKTDKHLDNHYLTSEAAAVLWNIALSYQFDPQFKLQDTVTGKFTVTPPVLQVNDASLKWGGLFDIYGKWASPHVEHRRGTVVDIRANSLPTAIPEVNFKEFKSLAADYGAEAFLEAPDIAHRHFHLRLFDRKE